MFNKIKKYFFTGVFGIIYVSFIAQLIYVLTLMVSDTGQAMFGLGLLSVQWLVIISARYLSKKSAGGGNREHSGGYNNYRR
ncbi:MAG: hypothetical protein FWE50_04860 [Alphaproteobacteria bacterium]|nr:hypothetical protein [Alphaproteobacteria bacterium]